MDSSTLAILIADITEAVYPDPRSLRERHVLSQSLKLLVHVAQQHRQEDADPSAQATQALLARAMRPCEPTS